MAKRTALWLNPTEAAGLDCILRAYLDTDEIPEEAPLRPHMQAVLRRLGAMPQDMEPVLWPKPDVIRAIADGRNP